MTKVNDNRTIWQQSNQIKSKKFSRKNETFRKISQTKNSTDQGKTEKERDKIFHLQCPPPPGMRQGDAHRVKRNNQPLETGRDSDPASSRPSADGIPRYKKP